MALSANPDVLDIPRGFVDRIAEWFCQSFADPYNNPRMAKSAGLYRLAGLVKKGVIVELGAYRGNGAVSLAAGAPDRVTYTIDDFNGHVDWMGNEPNMSDQMILLRNIKDSRLPIVWLDLSVEEAARSWTKPIGLLFWDTGSNDLHNDFEVWGKHLVPGGLFVMHDTDYFNFHSDEVTREALRLGWTLGPEYRTLYTVIKP